MEEKFKVGDLVRGDGVTGVVIFVSGDYGPNVEYRVVLIPETVQQAWDPECYWYDGHELSRADEEVSA